MAGAMKLRSTKALFTIAMLTATPACAASSPACVQSSFLFSKLAVASINCNFPEATARPFLALFADTMQHFCRGLRTGDPAGSKAGAMAFYSEVKQQGKLAVCGRILREFSEGTK